MKMQGVSFRHAVELLRTDPALVASARPVKQSTVPKLPAPICATDDERAALKQVIGYYHETLTGNTEALAYLDKRGLKSSEAIERFTLGYANRTLGLRLPEKNRKDGALLRGQLQRVGVMRASGHEHFAGSVVIPVFDAAGHVVEVYGRKINDGIKRDKGDATLYFFLPPRARFATCPASPVPSVPVCPITSPNGQSP